MTALADAPPRWEIVRSAWAGARSRFDVQVKFSTSGLIATTAAILAVWVLVFAALTPLIGHSAQARRYATLRENLAGGTTPIGGVIASGTPVALLSSSTLHLHNQVVVEGTTSKLLEGGPGHLPVSPLPGQLGWSVLMGRSGLYGAPFASLVHAAPGSDVTVTTGQAVMHFTVLKVRHAGEPIPALPVSGAGLTFVTTTPKGWFGAGSVVYIDAVLGSTGKVQPSPAGRPNVMLTSGAAMQGDSSQLMPLLLWLELLLVLSVGVVFTLRKWGMWQTWLVGVPLGLAALWGASSAALALLPNLL